MSLLSSFLFMLDALTLSPSSVAACDGELVVFTCTANVRVILWRITTPTRNYGPLAVIPSDVGRMMPFTTRDGVFKYGATSFINSSIELVSTLTTTANRSLDGTVVQCEEVGRGRNVTANLTHICNVNNIMILSQVDMSIFGHLLVIISSLLLNYGKQIVNKSKWLDFFLGLSLNMPLRTFVSTKYRIESVVRSMLHLIRSMLHLIRSMNSMRRQSEFQSRLKQFLCFSTRRILILYGLLLHKSVKYTVQNKT